MEIKMNGKLSGKEQEIFLNTKELCENTILNIKKQETNKQMNYFFDSNCNRG
jgi:hypothetical protein